MKQLVQLEPAKWSCMGWKPSTLGLEAIQMLAVGYGWTRSIEDFQQTALSPPLPSSIALRIEDSNNLLLLK